MRLALKKSLLLILVMSIKRCISTTHKKRATFLSDEENMKDKWQAEIIVDDILGRGILPAPVIFHNNLS